MLANREALNNYDLGRQHSGIKKVVYTKQKRTGQREKMHESYAYWPIGILLVSKIALRPLKTDFMFMFMFMFMKKIAQK